MPHYPMAYFSVRCDVSHCMGTALYRCGKRAFCQKHKQYAVERLQWRERTILGPKSRALELDNIAFDRQDSDFRQRRQQFNSAHQSKDRRS